ncbi:Uncharacterised protein [Shigella sonnei]|nr:Uncharacterised protein [Shigella sonnei]
MKLSRRSFMKANAVAAAAAAAGLSGPGGLPVSACRALPAPLLVSRKPLNGIKRRAVSAVLVAAFWSERSRGVWWPVRATRTHRLTVA